MKPETTRNVGSDMSFMEPKMMQHLKHVEVRKITILVMAVIAVKKIFRDSVTSTNFVLHH